MSEKSYLLAIDQSTSGTKALLMDCQGRLIDQEAREHRQIYPRPGWVEHDAEEIYRNVLASVGELLARHPTERAELMCLSITNQRETVVVFEAGSGRPLYHAIVWQDRRGAALCAELVAGGCQEMVRERTGLPIDTYFSASKLRWLIDTSPEIAGKLNRGEALVGTIDTYLIYRLTGGQVFATDSTNASRTLLYNIDCLGWDETLCALFHIPRRVLAEVRESSAAFGETTFDGLLDHPLPICGVMGDSQAALFAQGCHAPGTAKVTLGTGSSVLLNVGKRFCLVGNGIVSTIAWVYRGQPTYALEGVINFSAATISWLKNQLGLIATSAESEELACGVEDNGGVYLVPAFVGLGAPYWQPDAKGAIVGLTPASSRSHVVRAALEAIAYQVKDVLDLMVAEAGSGLQVMRADGGASRNAFLLQFMADLIRYPVRVPQLAELSALGAMYSGCLGMGLYSSLEALQALPMPFQTYAPHADPEKMSFYYAGWQAALNRVLD